MTPRRLDKQIVTRRLHALHETLDKVAANALAPCSGFRNVLVHRYTDIRVELVAQAIADVLARFPHYATAIATFVASQG